MAIKRMFHKDVVTTDKFTSLPLSCQALYFQICMLADDEGFVGNPEKLLNLRGRSRYAVEKLVEAGYLYKCDSGVVFVMHWKLHNSIPLDRFHHTVYVDEKNEISSLFQNMYLFV